ncbi:MAG: isoprenylcysteine carboxylmethyltransferase family protein [Candidatus Accumulibacter sp.]|jgi:protein-S-isoprenylcysteine O-methyltransferase Ste14|nr:isoprenylcysteine carboxylmethyltransferase family protein [Accumulibacter sp.]
MALKDEMVQSGFCFFRWRSYLPLLFLPVFVLALRDFSYPGGSEALDHLWEVFCVAIAVSGLTLRTLTVGHVPRNTSGRNMRRQKADALNTTGIYSIVRHPLYLGNFLVWIGLALFARDGWFLLVAILAFLLYYERIMLAEEEFLRTKFGAEFEAWARRTPALVPAFRKWRSPILSFSWKFVLARENPTWLATVVMFFLLEVIGDFFAGKMPHVDLGWILLVSATMVFYVVSRWMKKRNLLFVDGR